MNAVSNSLAYGSATLMRGKSATCRRQAHFLPQVFDLLWRSIKAADSRIEILINEPIGTIAPEIYSHFMEHLGGVIYDGVWVGEKSRIPNYNGIRKALVDKLKQLKPGVIRYPGGCFADQYDWRDGVGPRDKRPTRVNFWADTHYKTTKAYEDLESGPQKYESNHQLTRVAQHSLSNFRRRL